MYMSLAFLPLSCEVLHVSNGADFSLVDRTFLRVWFKCPLAVSVASG